MEINLHYAAAFTCGKEWLLFSCSQTSKEIHFEQIGHFMKYTKGSYANANLHIRYFRNLHLQFIQHKSYKFLFPIG